MESDVICISSEDEKSEPRRKVTKEKIVNVSPIRKVNKTVNGISTNGVNKVYTIKSTGNLTKDKVNQILKTNGALKAVKETNVVNKNTETKMNVPLVQSPIFKTGEISIIKRQINDDSDTPKPAVKRIKLTTVSTTTTTSTTTTKTSDDKSERNENQKITIDKNDNKKVVNETTSKTIEREASPTPGCSWFQEVQKPQLIIKEIKSLYDDEFDLFTTFIKTCIKKDSSDDMRKIVKKLKNRHERLDQSFLNGPVFKQLLIDKQKSIDLNDDRIYSHIMEVNDEMKNAARNNILERKHVKEEQININENEHQEEEEEENNQDSHEEKRKRRKAREILHRMESVKKRIEQLEMQEVDFSDESESIYLVEERYKKKLMQLWSAYCKYTGKPVDAGRIYLRPRDISVTQIQKVDKAIMNFINSKISRRNELMKKGKSIRDTIIFPDYVDILNCISQCNEKQNLRLTRSEQETKAKEAFEKIGVYLQRCRQRDYWDTFSFFLDEEDDDPSLKDPELSEKLKQNGALGHRRMESLFEEFAAKQNNMGEQKNANDSDSESADSNEDNEDDNENPDDSADKDDQVETEIDDDSSKEENNSSNKENTGKEESEKNSNKQNQTVEENQANHEQISANESTMCTNELNSNQSLNGNKSISKTSLSEVKETDADVIDIDDESNVDKQPLVRLRSFAKPPTSWKDSQGDGSTLVKKYVTLTEKLSPTAAPIIRKFVTSTPKACIIKTSSLSSPSLSSPSSSSSSPALVDLTSEKKDESKLSTINKSKTVMLPSNFKGKQIISVKNITNNYNVRVNQVPDKIIPMKVVPKTVNSNQIVANNKIIYHSNGNGKILNPLGKIVRLKLPQNSDAKVMKVLNLNEATKKVSMVIPVVQKPRMTLKLNSNQLSNEQASKISRYDHQYSKKIVNNIVRIIKPTEQLDPNKLVTLKKT